MNQIDETKILVKSKHEFKSAENKSVLNQIRNALNFCLPFRRNHEIEVYQLKTYISNPKKAKLIFVSGVTHIIF